MTHPRQEWTLPLRGKWLVYFLIVAVTEAGVYLLFRHSLPDRGMMGNPVGSERDRLFSAYVESFLLLGFVPSFCLIAGRERDRRWVSRAGWWGLAGCGYAFLGITLLDPLLTLILMPLILVLLGGYMVLTVTSWRRAIGDLILLIVLCVGLYWFWLGYFGAHWDVYGD